MGTIWPEALWPIGWSVGRAVVKLEEPRRIAEDELLACSLELAALDDSVEPQDAAAQAAAVKLEVEWRVACWVAQKNRAGLAPSTTAVLGEFAWRHAMIAEPVRPAALGTSDDAVARKRVARWRQRWGGRVSRLPVREVVPQAVMVEKVSAGWRLPVRSQADRRCRERCGGDSAAHAVHVGGW